MFHAEEKILQKFKEPIAIEEDKKDDSIGLTATMEFEFRQAFELVSGGEESIPKDKIIEILRAVGFSFQSWDIDCMLSNSLSDEADKYTCDILIEAFEEYMNAQITMSDLYNSFIMLKQKKKIAASHVLQKYEQFDESETLCDKVEETVQLFDELLNELLCTHAGNRISAAEVMDVIQEISSSENESIQFGDFARIFTNT